MFRKIAACAALVFLGGCATGAADKDLSFGPDSKKALVVLGLENLEQWRGMSVGVIFKGLDANRKLDRRDFYVSNGNGWLAMQPVEYLVVEVDAGTYVADATMTHNGVQQTMIRYCKGTLTFDAPAGKAVYIGNFAAPPLNSGIGVRPVAPHLEAAVAKMAEFPNIKQGLTQGQVTPVSYPDPERCTGFRQ